MKAYSTDLRERVILAANQGIPQVEIANVFAISLSIIKWVSQAMARDRNTASQADPRPALQEIGALASRCEPDANGSS
jgi:transposase